MNQGRKNKKRAPQPTQTPLRTSVTLPPKDVDVHPNVPESQAPLIDMDTPLPDLDSMPLEPSPQLSPPASPMPRDTPSTPPANRAARFDSPEASSTRRIDSFTRIESPPNSPPFPPVNSTTIYKRPSNRPPGPITRSSRASIQAYGSNPHIIACISCNDFCLLTGARGVPARLELGLDQTNTDTFFPTVCSACENHRGFLWLRMEGGRSPPGQRQQYPETLHSSIVSRKAFATELL